MFLLQEPSPYKFNPVDEVWQRSVSAMLGLQCVRKNRVRPGDPNVPLTPDMRTVKHITGDGNCLFCSFAYIMTGSEDQHMAVYKDYTSNPIPTSFFFKCNPSQSSRTIA